MAVRSLMRLDIAGQCLKDKPPAVFYLDTTCNESGR